MNLEKIGEFILECRKNKHLTQIELAQKLNISDRAISKWERGKSMPDSSIMLNLCNILDITVNELLSGEKIEQQNFNKQAELNIIEIKKQKEASDKRLLMVEIALMSISSLFIIFCFMIGSYIFKQDSYKYWLSYLLFGVGFIQFFISALISIRIEQVAGYYECKYCKNTFIPTYKQSSFAMHICRTKYMKCPHCGKKSWQKKVISKDKN